MYKSIMGVYICINSLYTLPLTEGINRKIIIFITRRIEKGLHVVRVRCCVQTNKMVQTIFNIWTEGTSLSRILNTSLPWYNLFCCIAIHFQIKGKEWPGGMRTRKYLNRGDRCLKGNFQGIEKIQLLFIDKFLESPFLSFMRTFIILMKFS